MTFVDAAGGLRSHWRSVAILTMGMGTAVAASWLAVVLPFGLVDSFGLDPESMTRPRRLAVYALQLVLVGGIGYAAGRQWPLGRSVSPLAGTLALAWVLEGVVLTVIGARLVANEITPDRAWYFWLVATAGPLHPAMAFLGSWIGHRAASRANARS